MSSLLQDVLEINYALNAVLSNANNLMKLGIEYKNTKDKVFLTGAGTSYYASLYAMMHALYNEGGKNKCIYAVPSSEFILNYSKVADERSLVIAISRSGETAETLEALKRAKDKGADTIILSITSREKPNFIDHYVVIDAGPERSVVMTKSFMALSASAAVLIDALLNDNTTYLINSLSSLSLCIKNALSDAGLRGKINHVINKWVNEGKSRFIFLGQGIAYPIALEAALKFEETSYVAVQALNALEFRHGPMATVGENEGIIIFNPLSNVVESYVTKLFTELLEKSKDSSTDILMITNDEGLYHKYENNAIYVPCGNLSEDWAVLSFMIPIYLLVNDYAMKRGVNMENPRNLVRVVKQF